MGNSHTFIIKNLTNNEIQVTISQAQTSWKDYVIKPNQKVSNTYFDSIIGIKIKYQDCHASYMLVGDNELTIKDENNGEKIILTSNDGENKTYIKIDSNWKTLQP